MAERSHHDYAAGEQDPYQSIRYLGHGAIGSVDEVVLKSDENGEVYARKQVRLVGRKRDEILEELNKEAQIIWTLRHRHIVELLETYTWSSHFSIVMSPVAETDLRKYLEDLDSQPWPPKSTENFDEFNRRLFMFTSWAACLVVALDYLHENRVKHRDIKPSNILIKNNNIYLTDFGTSRLIPEDATTGTTGAYGAMSRLYAAPEVFQDRGRRGRVTDVFSLGCVFLELVTTLIQTQGAQERFYLFRKEVGGSAAYHDSQSAVLQWICFAWKKTTSYAGGELLGLAFLMLDPSPSQRATTKNLITIMANSEQFSKILYRYDEQPACSQCHTTIYALKDHRCRPGPSVLQNIPSFRFVNDDALISTTPDPQIPTSWEGAKQRWLPVDKWWCE